MLSLFQTLLGHQSSVRSLSFSPCSSILCSGCLSGEVRLWSVAAAACVGSYHAHRGSTQSLNFLQGGNLLLSAGHDSVVRTMVLHSSFSIVRFFFLHSNRHPKTLRIEVFFVVQVNVWSGGLGRSVAVLGEKKVLSCS